MSRWKIGLLVSLAMLLVGGAVFYYVNSKDHYDPSKYQATIVDGLEEGGLQVGSRVSLTLPDQFDKSHSIGPQIETLILAFSKDTGGLVRGFLNDRQPEFLKSHNAIFIADISPFPVALRNAFALPLLRKSSYPVLLIYESTMSRELSNPKQSDRVTVATLRSGIVQRVEYISTETELENVFQKSSSLSSGAIK